MNETKLTDEEMIAKCVAGEWPDCIVPCDFPCAPDFRNLIIERASQTDVEWIDARSVLGGLEEETEATR